MATSAPPVYFGNLAKAGFVKAPDRGLDAGAIGGIDSMTFSSGGAFNVPSPATHRKFGMDWSYAQVEDIQFLFNYRNGLYGKGLLYWVDPYASYYNALPPHWAAPFLSTTGWPSLMGSQNDAIQVPATSPINNQPIYSARYSISTPISTVPDRALVLLIPPTSQLSIGFSGSATNGGVVRVQPITINNTFTATEDLTLLPAVGATRMNKTYSGAVYSAIRVYLTSTATGTSTVTLDSGDAIYSPVGTTPLLTGNHNEGRGHSGLKWASDPTMAYQFFDDGGVQPRRYVSSSATFEEIGAWL